MVFDGVQLVRGGVAAFAWKLLLGVVRPRAVRDVNVAAAEMAASFEGWRGRRSTVYDDTRRKKFCVLRERDERGYCQICDQNYSHKSLVFWNDLGVCNSLIVLWIALSNCRLFCQDYTHYNLVTIR